MGVHGLWKLIDAAGKPVPVETLENRILAVDVSIWLHQLVKGFQDSTGSAGVNAHLLGLFYRICKLLFFRIKPVFVFDGGVPVLKRKTIAARQSNRSKASESLEKVRQELLQNLLKQHALGKILGQNVKIPKNLTGKQDNMFFLPPIPSTSSKEEAFEGAATWEDSEKSVSSEAENYEDESSSSDDLSPSKKYGDIHSIDLKSKDFKALPADMRHDILSELKETRKQNSWARVHLMPEEVGDFSSFQMDRLLKRRSVQVELEEAEKEMGPRCFTVSEIQEILEYQGVDISQKSQRIASDSTTRFLYSSQNLEKGKNAKMETITEMGEESDSDIDDPLIDSLKANEDMSQEDILKLIREEETKKKARELVSDCGKSTKNANEPTVDEIRNTVQTNLDPGKIQASTTTFTKKQITFHNKQVTQLLRDSAQKNFIPISKIDKVLERKKKRNTRKKVVRKVSSTGPKLSESDTSDSDVPEIKSKPQLSANDSVTSSFKDNNILHDEQINAKFTESVKSMQSPIQLKNDISDSNIQNCPIDKLSSVDDRNVTSSGSGKSESSDEDFEEVPAGSNMDCSIGGNVIDITYSKERNNSKDSKNSSIDEKENKTREYKGINIELNFNKIPSDEEDIFADVFEVKKIQNEVLASISPKCVTNKSDTSEHRSVTLNAGLNLKKPISAEKDITDHEDEDNKTQPSNKDRFLTDCSKDKNVSISKSINIEINLDKSASDEEDIFADVFNVAEVPPSKPDSIICNVVKSEEKIEDIKKIVHSKEAERAVILEDLILAKNKLELEVGVTKSPSSVELDNPLKSEDDFEEADEEKITETQESLEEKNYFNDDNLILENEGNKEEKSPNSFAKKLATVEQVRQFQSSLERESSSLIKEKRRDEKIAATLSEQITVEAQELLRLFGIPYMVAPMEAEAQCAFLDINGLTQGTITDDSDIWLFGANNVYKNFFDQKKFVKLFKSSDVKRVYNLGRTELIMLGLLVGSDYTTGLNGVGPVTALEIVANFPQEETDVFPSRDRLSRFATAFSKHKLNKKLTKKLLPVQLIEGFPSIEVVRAYTDPQVDENKETFSWGSPNMERIRDYAMEKFGWDANKTDKTLEPIIDKLKQTKTQMTIHGFFDWAFEDVQGKMSKRVENAVNLLGATPAERTQHDDDDASSQETTREKAKRVLSEEKKSGRKRKAKKLQTVEEGPSTSSSSLNDFTEEIASKSSVPDFLLAGPSTMDPFTPKIPSEPKSRKKEKPIIPTLPRVNATIEKLRKGKSLSDKPRIRRSRETVSLTRPTNELDFDGPFGTGETRKRKKVPRTDVEKLREIEEARAKAARVLAKIKNVEQFHGNV